MNDDDKYEASEAVESVAEVLTSLLTRRATLEGLGRSHGPARSVGKRLIRARARRSLRPEPRARRSTRHAYRLDGHADRASAENRHADPANGARYGSRPSPELTPKRAPPAQARVAPHTRPTTSPTSSTRCQTPADHHIRPSAHARQRAALLAEQRLQVAARHAESRETDADPRSIRPLHRGERRRDPRRPRR